MSDIYLAYTPNPQASWSLEDLDWDKNPLGLLVSFFYLADFRAKLGKVRPSFYMLDSGAFSAWNSKSVIDIAALTEETKNPMWAESVALDVIGDAEGSRRNAFWMKARGSPAFPVFHIGEPLSLLKEYCSLFPKVGLSCRFGEGVPDSMRFLNRCFSAAYPHRFHSFGWVAEQALCAFPFHSADAVSWALRPHAFGSWKRFRGMPGGRINMRNSSRSIFIAEIEFYATLQDKLKGLWRKEMASLARKSASTSGNKSEPTPETMALI